MAKQHEAKVATKVVVTNPSFKVDSSVEGRPSQNITVIKMS